MNRIPAVVVRSVVAVLLAAAAAAAAGRLDAQSQAPAVSLSILSPANGVYASGPTPLIAKVEPAAAVSAVIFFVDGRQLCVVTAEPFTCDWNAGRLVTEHQIRIVATLATGDGRVVQTLRTKGLAYVENVDVDVVQVTVTVTDNHGQFIRGIPQSAFSVFENDQPQKISHFESENVPLDLIVAIDISGSMAPSMPKLKKAVKEFLGAVPAGNQVTLLGFNDTMFTLTRRATNPADRIKAVDRLAPWGSTALYDVILRGIGLLGTETGRKALVIFTDGEDQGSHAAIADVERGLQSSDVTLYMIGQGRGVKDDNLRQVMRRLSTPTGGRALFTDNIDQLHGAFDDLLNELSNQYLLGYPSTDTKRDDAWRRIRVDVAGYPLVRARQGYRLSK
jgi:Ca-activated chloride channel family protein